MAITDRARDFWDRISPRERKLVIIAGIAAPLIVAIWLGLSIRDGLNSMEERNDKTRHALEIVEDLKLRGNHEPTEDAPTIPNEPLGLETYVSNAAKKTGLTFKGPIDSRPKVVRNGFVTTTISCALDDVTTDQLKAFLQDVESGSKVVAVTHLDIKRDFRDKKKLDASFEISTYSLEAKKGGEGSGSGSAEKKGS
ncbi:MAG TPA: type II secretion system protein GspM [Kofleriaceae bacterium]|nr:type II secretion system protein GspM [Kofleriaceae bacterium]